MVSAIDPTVPVFGSPTTASVRSNFLIAKNEITALQNAVGVTFPIGIAQGGTGATTAPVALTNLGAVPLAGGTMTGPLLLNANPTNNLGAATKQYVDGMFPVSVSNGGTGANNANSALANLGAAPLASPAFTGIPTAPTPPTGDSSTIVATTAFVHNVVSALPASVSSIIAGAGITVSGPSGNVTVGLTVPVSVANGGTGAGTATAALTNLGGAPLASPVFTGVPAAPTPPPGTNTTQLATTAFVLTAIGAGAGVSTVTGASGGGILVNGLAATPASGAVALALSAPVSIANGGTGATNANGAFDSLLGGISSGSGFITRQTGGAYTLTPATLTPTNRSLIINASNAITTSSIMSDNGSTITVNQNPVAPPANGTFAAPTLNIMGTTGGFTSLTLDSYGTGGGNYVAARRARGTPGTPTAVQSNDELALFGAQGFDGSAYAVFGQTMMNITAVENWTTAARGTAITFSTVTPGQLNPSNSLILMGIHQRMSGGLLIGYDNAPTTPDPGLGCLTLNANTVAPAINPSGNLQIIGADGTNPQISMEAFGGAGNTSVIYTTHARGTAAVPAPTQVNDFMLLIQPGGYTGAAYAFTSAIQLQAVDTFSASAQGTRMTLATVPTGTTGAVNSLVLTGSLATFAGNITIPTGGALYFNGAVSTGRISSDAANIIIDLAGAGGDLIVRNAAITLTLLSVDSGGNLTINGANATKASGTTWANPSSRELKQDLQPYQQGLDAVLALNPMTYRFNETSGFDTDDTHIGLLHDETSHMPEMHRKLLIGGTPEESGREVDGLDCSAVTFALINAVKELKAELNALKAGREMSPAPATPAVSAGPAPATRTTTTPTAPTSRRR